MTARAPAILLAVALGGCAARTEPPAAVSAPAVAPALRDLQAISDLQSAFDRDRAHPRVVLLLSPT